MIPVTKEVIAEEVIDFAAALLCALVHSQCGTGQTEHHNDEEHGQEQAGSGIACEEAGHLTGNDRAVRLGVRAEVKVDVRVEYVMQTDRDEQTVEETEDEDTDSAQLGNTDCEAVEYHLNGRPDKAQHIAETNGCDRSEGDNELFTGKEVEDLGGLPILTVVEDPCGEAADDDTGEDAHADGLVECSQRGLEYQDGQQARNHGRYLVLCLGEGNNGTECKENVHVAEYDITGRLEQRDIEHIRGSDTGQDTGNRHGSNRNEHRSAELC